MTEERENILVIKLGALGDFVQALGPMAAIRRHHPDSQITLLTTAPFVSFGQGCGLFDHIWTDSRPRWHQPGAWLALRKKLNGGRFSRVYDLQNNDRTSFYFRLFSRRNKPEWVGVAPGASHRNTSPERTAGLAFDGHVQTLGLAGITDIAPDDLGWIQGDIARFGMNGEPYVLLIPGSAPQHPEKRWPSENYAELARILDGWGYRPVVIGTAAEARIGAEIARYHPGTIDLTGQTSLFDIVLLARHAAAAIGNDTGPMHLIAPTGCPSWVLFSGHSNPVRHAPKGPAVTAIRRDELTDLKIWEVVEQLGVRAFREPGSATQAETYLPGT